MFFQHRVHLESEQLLLALELVSLLIVVCDAIHWCLPWLVVSVVVVRCDFWYLPPWSRGGSVGSDHVGSNRLVSDEGS